MAGMSHNEQRQRQSTLPAAATARQADAQHLAETIASSGGLEHISVRVQRTATSASADVSGNAPMIFDLGLGRITETATAPLERVTRP